MSYLQALQRAKLDRETTTNKTASSEALNDAIRANGEALPGILASQHLGIGGPASTLRASGVDTVEVTLEGIKLNESIATALDSRDAALSSIPEIHVDVLSADPHAVSVTQPQSIYCEEYRSLRTHLLRQSKLQHLQAIVIASVGVGEGKSITALNLAWLLAQTEGVSALLIDCDLRRPSLSGYFGLNLKDGLSNVLDGHMNLADGIVRLMPAGLYLLPGGKARADVAELISGQMFAQILEEARSLFDYVIIDAPPLGVFTDAAVLINQADAALMVVAANQTKYKEFDRVLESVPRERMLGVVLNKSDESLIENGYYDYPHYYTANK